MQRPRGLLASVSAAGALLASPGLAPAAIPTGSFEIQFGGKQSIWAGEPGVDQGEQFCEELEAEFDALESCDFDIFVDGKGKIFGYFGYSGWIDGLYFDQGGPIRGTQRGDDRSGISRISFKIRLTGTASDGFETLPTRSSIRLSQQTTADGSMSGVWTTRVCVKGVGCYEAEEPVTSAILSNGGWTLQIEITDEADDTLGGSARAEFGDGSECLYFVSGKYSARRDTARLRLDPAEPECRGTSLRLKDVRLFSGPPDEIAGSIAYRLFGFRGDTSFPDAASLSYDALRDYYDDPHLFAFVCQGTVAIAASVDPSACSWAIPSDRDELAIQKRTLAEELSTFNQGPSFGRRDFVFLEERPDFHPDPIGGVLGGVGYQGSAGVSVSVIVPAPTPIEERPRLEELEP